MSDAAIRDLMVQLAGKDERITELEAQVARLTEQVAAAPRLTHKVGTVVVRRVSDMPERADPHDAARNRVLLAHLRSTGTIAYFDSMVGGKLTDQAIAAIRGAVVSAVAKLLALAGEERTADHDRIVDKALVVDKIRGAVSFDLDTLSAVVPERLVMRGDLCATEGCTLRAAVGSTRCPPCRSIASGHGL